MPLKRSKSSHWTAEGQSSNHPAVALFVALKGRQNRATAHPTAAATADTTENIEFSFVGVGRGNRWDEPTCCTLGLGSRANARRRAADRTAPSRAEQSRAEMSREQRRAEFRVLHAGIGVCYTIPAAERWNNFSATSMVWSLGSNLRHCYEGIRSVGSISGVLFFEDVW